jgi:hypothetical protein
VALAARQRREVAGRDSNLRPGSLACAAQTKATAAVAAEDLRRYAPIHGTQMLAATPLLHLLGSVISAAPEEPAACSAMWVLAQLSVQPGGRARIRDHCGVVSHLCRWVTGGAPA